MYLDLHSNVESFAKVLKRILNEVRISEKLYNRDNNSGTLSALRREWGLAPLCGAAMTFSHGSLTPFAPIVEKQDSKVDVLRRAKRP
jgi:hypothetical protein